MKKTRCLSLFLAVLLMFCSMFSLVSTYSATKNTYGKFVFQVLGDNCAQITGYKGKDSSVEIPKALGEYTVSSLGNSLFNGHTELKSVKLPSTLTSIGDYAFDCCTGLTQVTVPDSVTNIGKGAFFSCSRLKTATLPKSLKTLGDGAFYDCISLQSIALGDSVTSVGEFAFGNCSKLQSVTIGSSLTEISNQMFLNCSSLKEIVIPNGVNTIGRKAFSKCTSLSSVTIPNSVSVIMEEAFYGCSVLKSISTNAEALGEQAFTYCSELKALNLTDNLKSIAKYTFYGCNLSELDIPSSVEEIEYGAFATSNLQRINVDNKKYTTVDGVVYSKDMTEIICHPGMKDDAEIFTIPDTVTTVAPYAFSNCYALKSVNFPESVEKIGDYAFENTSALEKIEIPNTVTYVGEGAFSNSNITDLTISGSVKEISRSAFDNCGGLTTLTLGEGITKIDDFAFSECYSIENLELPASVKEVSSTAFYNTGIKSFSVNSLSENLTVEDGVLFTKDKKELVAYPPRKGDSAYTIPDGTEKVDDYAMAMNNSVNCVTVPNSVSSIGKNALGFMKNYSSDSYDRIADFMILGKDNSYAEEYATENDVAFFTEKPDFGEKSISLNSGSTYTFNIKGAVDGDVEYSSSDESIATVDQKGKITGVSKGETVVIASAGTIYLKCKVKVLNGKSNPNKKLKFYSKFTELNIKNYENWEKDYYKLNAGTSFSQLDNPNIKCYTSNEFIPIVGVQEGSGYMFEMTKQAYGEDYGQYKIIADNLATELGKFKNDKDLVLFSGTDDVSLMTGKTSSVKDMKNSVGNRYTTKRVVSTSIAHSASVSFGEGSYHTMLEIYAPASAIKGGYIKNISVNPQEYEILLDKGLKYEVLEAGVRQVPVTDFNGGQKTVETERYMKVKLLTDENQNTDPTNPTKPTKPTTPTDPTNPTNPSNPSKENKGNGSIPTGDNSFTPTVVFASASLLSLILFLCLRKKKED
ncbi:MAG: leucine-rich repeat protein [Ruminococcus sp.]